MTDNSNGKQPSKREINSPILEESMIVDALSPVLNAMVQGVCP